MEKHSLFISAELHVSADAVSAIIREICEAIGAKEFELAPYSSDITDVGIIVNCFPPDYMAAGWGKPRTYLSYQRGSADIRLPIPYQEFMGASKDKQYLMVMKNIVQSIQVIEERRRKSKRARFDGQRMIGDILEKLELTPADLENIPV